MPHYPGETHDSHSVPPTSGVLLCNLGTPTAPTPGALRRFLAQFLSDPRVVELPRWLWLPILYGIILTFRPRRSARAYAKVWTPAGSPLRVFSEQQAAALACELATTPNIKVALAMRYGEPSIAAALAELRTANVQQILVLPVYPQYSGAATGSVFDAVTRELLSWRRIPAFRFIASYHDDPGYIAALASSVREHWQANGPSERLYLSFHGIPHRSVLAGDPYFDHCHATARLVAERLGLAQDQWQVVFQSRFGRARWLEPYAAATFQAAARAGTKVIDVVCPGFAVDCLETLEEIAIQNRDLFSAAGGEALRYIPALNARADHIQVLASLIARNLAPDTEHVQVAMSRI
ncbi:MAG: ferrochelatase [Gammaproteobacteria bacterium]|nr:ferrochelatase [Gammaproteobacteria bacterium]